MNYKVYIPSYNRVNSCITHNILPDKKWCYVVRKSQLEDYKKTVGDVIATPDSVNNIVKTRNWILENTPEDHIVMMDDDIRSLSFYDDREPIKADKDQIDRFITNGFEMCEELGGVLWGVNVQSDKKFYREQEPFTLTAVVLGPFSAIIKNDIRYDERLTLKEDYDYFLQVLNKYRKVLRFNKWHYVAGHLTQKGGVASYRTTEAEKENALSFQKKWGSKIVKFGKTQNGNVSFNPKILTPI